jgi:hypothetical protein
MANPWDNTKDLPQWWQAAWEKYTRQLAANRDAQNLQGYFDTRRNRYITGLGKGLTWLPLGKSEAEYKLQGQLAQGALDQARAATPVLAGLDPVADQQQQQTIWEQVRAGKLTTDQGAAQLAALTQQQQTAWNALLSASAANPTGYGTDQAAFDQKAKDVAAQVQAGNLTTAQAEQELAAPAGAAQPVAGMTATPASRLAGVRDYMATTLQADPNAVWGNTPVGLLATLNDEGLETYLNATLGLTSDYQQQTQDLQLEQARLEQEQAREKMRRERLAWQITQTGRVPTTFQDSLNYGPDQAPPTYSPVGSAIYDQPNSSLWGTWGGDLGSRPVSFAVDSWVPGQGYNYDPPSVSTLDDTGDRYESAGGPGTNPFGFTGGRPATDAEKRNAGGTLGLPDYTYQWATLEWQKQQYAQEMAWQQAQFAAQQALAREQLQKQIEEQRREAQAQAELQRQNLLQAAWEKSLPYRLNSSQEYAPGWEAGGLIDQMYRSVGTPYTPTPLTHSNAPDVPVITV